MRGVKFSDKGPVACGTCVNLCGTFHNPPDVCLMFPVLDTTKNGHTNTQQVHEHTLCMHHCTGTKNTQLSMQM